MSVVESAGYPGVIFLMFVENIFPPIPSEVIMPLAGFMVTQDKFSFVAVVIAGTLGSVLGALPIYYAGRKIGEDRIKNFADRHGRWLTVSRADIDGAKKWFDKHGGAAVFFCHLVPGVRSLISLPAGMDRMHPASFLLYTTGGALLWAALLAGVGYFLGSNFKKVEEYLDPASYVILGVIVVLYVWRVVRHKGDGVQK